MSCVARRDEFCSGRRADLKSEDVKPMRKKRISKPHNKAKLRGLALSSIQIAALRDHLEGYFSKSSCNDTPRQTEKWLREQKVVDIEGTLEMFRQRGGYCDCEVLLNVVGR